MQKNYKKQINKCENRLLLSTCERKKKKRPAFLLLKIRGFCFEIRQHCSQTAISSSWERK